MIGPILEKLFAHNNWANLQIIQVCSALTDEQLDAEPQSATQGSIRSTLFHLVTSQRGYLRFLTLPLEARLVDAPTVAFTELQESARISGEGLLALASIDCNSIADPAAQHCLHLTRFAWLRVQVKLAVGHEGIGRFRVPQ